MFKCKDAAGRITYSSEDCAKAGLDPAGAVKERVIVQTTRKPKPLPALPPDLEHPSAPAKESADGEEKCSIIMTPFGYRKHCAKPAGAID